MKKKPHSDLTRVRELEDRDIIRNGDATELKEETPRKTVFFPRGVRTAKEVQQAFEEKYGIDLAFFDRPVVVEPQTAETISLRIPTDLLEWWRKQGKGYQTRIVGLMRAYMLYQIKKVKAS